MNIISIEVIWLTIYFTWTLRGVIIKLTIWGFVGYLAFSKSAIEHVKTFKWPFLITVLSLSVILRPLWFLCGLHKSTTVILLIAHFSKIVNSQ
jgi:hypothetical protein